MSALTDSRPAFAACAADAFETGCILQRVSGAENRAGIRWTAAGSSPSATWVMMRVQPYGQVLRLSGTQVSMCCIIHTPVWRTTQTEPKSGAASGTIARAVRSRCAPPCSLTAPSSCEPEDYVVSRVKNATTNFPSDGIFTDNVVANERWYPYYAAIADEARRSNPQRKTAFNPNCAHKASETCSPFCTHWGHSKEQCADCTSNRCSGMTPEFLDLADVHLLSEGTVRERWRHAMHERAVSPLRKSAGEWGPRP